MSLYQAIPDYWEHVAYLPQTGPVTKCLISAREWWEEEIRCLADKKKDYGRYSLSLYALHTSFFFFFFFALGSLRLEARGIFQQKKKKSVSCYVNRNFVQGYRVHCTDTHAASVPLKWSCEYNSAAVIFK